MLLASDRSVVHRCGLETLEAAVRGPKLAAIFEGPPFSAVIGLKFEAMARFCSSPISESTPLIVVATGRLIA